MAIYFIQCGKNGPIKIGQTSNGVEDRIKQLQTGCPYELKLLWVYVGEEYTEPQIHRMFKHEHIRGEWFRPSRKITEFIGGKLENNFTLNLPNHGNLSICENSDGPIINIYNTDLSVDIDKSGNIVMDLGGIGFEYNPTEDVFNLWSYYPERMLGTKVVVNGIKDVQIAPEKV